MGIKQEVLKDFAAKKVLVTGGTGMIGRQVVDILSDSGADITIVSLDKIKVDEKARHIFGDLTDFSFCKKICEGMDYVFHIAGVGASVKAAKTKMATHFTSMLMMSTNILEACRLNKVEKALFTSSVGAYAKAEVLKESEYRLDSMPMDFASWAKRMAEAQIYAYKMEHGLDNFSIVRPANIYGPGDNFGPENSLVVPSLLYRFYCKEDPLVVWGDGSAKRDFAVSRDIAEGIVLALHYGTKAEIVNLGSGRAYSIRELVETLREFLDFNYVFDASKPQGDKLRVMDISKARQMLGYDPQTSLRDGLEKTWKWFIQNPKQYSLKKNYFIAGEKA